MINKLTPVTNSTLSQILLCDSLHIDELPNPRIVPLFGPNGVGKSSVIKALLGKLDFGKQQFEAESTGAPMKVLGYCDRTDNARVRQPRDYNEAFDPRYMLDRFNAASVSEGQSILYSAMDLFDLIGTSKKALREEGIEYLVVIDEIDSGLSIDNLDTLMRKLKNTAKRRPDVQVAFSFNNPFVVQYFPDALSLYTGHPVHLETPADMMREIKAHEADFRKKRYHSNGMPIVFGEDAAERPLRRKKKGCSRSI